MEDERERISKIRARPPVRLRAVHTTGAADGAESATREREVVFRKVGHTSRHYPVRFKSYTVGTDYDQDDLRFPKLE